MQVLSASETVESEIQGIPGIVADLATGGLTDRWQQILGPFHRINPILA